MASLEALRAVTESSSLSAFKFQSWYPLEVPCVVGQQVAAGIGPQTMQLLLLVAVAFLVKVRQGLAIDRPIKL